MSKTEVVLYDGGIPSGIASVEPTGESEPGDVIIGCRKWRASVETCIVTIACDRDGTFTINVLDGDGCTIGGTTEMVVEP